MSYHSEDSTRSVPTLKKRRHYNVTKIREAWTAEEHEIFLTGVKEYGRNWKMIEEMIPTRTCQQIRSHAQKHFAKLAEEGHVEEVPLARPKKKVGQLSV